MIHVSCVSGMNGAQGCLEEAQNVAAYHVGQSGNGGCGHLLGQMSLGMEEHETLVQTEDLIVGAILLLRGFQVPSSLPHLFPPSLQLGRGCNDLTLDL